MLRQHHLLLHQLHILRQPPLHAPDLPPAADPELLADHGDQPLVVAHQDHSTLVLGQPQAQGFYRLNVEMIGGLV